MEKKKMREIAEEKWSKENGFSNKPLENLSLEEVGLIIHDLQVHQIELEMQNEELKRIQNELDLSKARYFELYDLAPEGYLVISEKGLILEANLTVANMIGLERAQLLGQRLSQFIYREDSDIFYLHRKKLYETKENQECDFRIIRKDGTLFWGHSKAVFVTNEGLNFCRLILSDISKRMNALSKLKESEEKYRLVYSSMSQGMALHEIITDNYGKPIDYIYLDINNSYESLLHVKREDVIGKRITEVMPKVEPYWIDTFGKVALTGVPMEYENYLETTGRYYNTYTYCTKHGQFAVLVTDITERKQVLEQLKQKDDLLNQTNERLNQLASHTRTIAWEIDKRGIFTFVSDVCQEVWGYTPEDLVGKKHFYDLHLAQNREKLYTVVMDTIRNERKFNDFLNYVLSKTGEKIWMSTSAIPTYDKEGNFKGYIGNDVDVTERTLSALELEKANNELNQIRFEMQSALMLKKEHELWKNILDTIPDFIMHRNPEGVIQLINKVAETTIISDGGSAEGRSIKDFYSPKIASRILKSDLEVIEKQQSISEQVVTSTKEGSRVIVYSKTPLIDAAGEAIGVVEVGRDITDFLSINKELQKNNQMLELLATTASDFLQLPKDGNYDSLIYNSLLLFSEQAQSDSAYMIRRNNQTNICSCTNIWSNIDNLYTNPVMMDMQNSLFFDYYSKWLTTKVNTSFSTEEISPKESEILRFLWLIKARQTIVFPLMNDNILLGYICFSNPDKQIIKRKKEMDFFKALASIISSLLIRQGIEESLSASSMELTRTIQKKNDFFASMSHQIRTPLTGMATALSLIGMADVTEEQNHYLEIAQTSLESLRSIVTGILDLNKIENKKIEIVIETCCLEDELVKIVRTQELITSEKNLEMLFEIDDTIPDRIQVDITHLKQIVYNLLNNAIKFTDSGFVKFIVKLDECSNQSCRITFEIRDSGVGISADNLVNISNRYFQVAPYKFETSAGTGLGLSIASELTRLLGGKLNFQSELGVGSVFSFTLEFQIAPDHIITRPLQPCRVLLVDNTAKTDRIFGILQNAKIQVKTVNPKEFLSYYKTSDFHPNYVIFREKMTQEIIDHLENIKHQYAADNLIFVVCMHHSERVSSGLYKLKSIDILLEKFATKNELLNILFHHGSEQQKNNSFIPKKIVFSEQKTILLVEDNLINNKALSMLIAKFGVNVDSVYNALEAMDKTLQKNYDLILMDIQMPGMDGIEATHKIRRQNPYNQSVPIVAITAHAFKEEQMTIIDAGFDDLLTKPIRQDELVALLSKCFRSGFLLKEEDPRLIIPPELVTFEQKDFLERLNQSWSLSQELIAIFFNENAEEIDKIKSNLKTKNYPDLYAVLHNYKGSCDYLSAQRLVWLINQTMETLHQETQSELVPKFVELIVEESNRLLVRLQEYNKLMPGEATV